MATDADNLNDFLDPRALARVKSLELRTRRVVEGLMQGRHRSPHQGSSVEFAQHRPYVQGDDVRHIDWKVFGRSDKLHIKQFQEETQLQIILAVDASESMDFGTVTSHRGRDTWTKFDHATTLAATLAYLATLRSDAVGLAIFDESLIRYVRPSATRGQWRTLVNELQAVPRWNKTGVGGVLRQLAGKIKGRSLVVVLSDFFDDPVDIEKGLKALRFRNHDLVCLQLLDPEETAFRYDDVTLFKGMEEAGELLIEPKALRQGYLDALASHHDAVSRICGKIDTDFERFDTGESLEMPLSVFLAGRGARLRR
ncbi:MAG: DUF58 domain-containing protein [Planctomycetota bacterium]